MRKYDIGPVEDAIWSVLSGTRIDDAARRAGTVPARLADAVERYRAAGWATLDARTTAWHQVNIEFADYPTAERAFRAYLLPLLLGAPVGAWWFLRSTPGGACVFTPVRTRPSRKSSRT